MTTVKLNQSGIIALEKAMWLARILSVIDKKSLPCYKIEQALNTECRWRNMKCISGGSIRKYLNEMVNRGLLISESRYVRRSPRIYYSKPVKPEVLE